MPPNEFLSKRRLELGLRQRDVAEALGLDKSTPAAWEEGRRNPSPHHLPPLLALLQITPEEAEEHIQVSRRSPKKPAQKERGPTWLYNRRRSRQLSQTELSGMLGIDASFVSRMESGLVNVPLSVFAEYAIILGVSEKEFKENAIVTREYVRKENLEAKERAYATRPRTHDQIHRLPTNVERAGTCLEPCKCLRWRCAICLQYWTGLPTDHDAACTPAAD